MLLLGFLEKKLACKYSDEDCMKKLGNLTWKPPHENWTKINIGASRIISKGLTPLRCVMKDNQAEFLWLAMSK